MYCFINARTRIDVVEWKAPASNEYIIGLWNCQPHATVKFPAHLGFFIVRNGLLTSGYSSTNS